MVFKNSVTTPVRVVNDNSTSHQGGGSCNIAQAKGRKSINACNRVLWHFFINPVPLVLDISKCYRSIRTKLLTNVLRKVLWFADVNDESTIQAFMMIRMAFGDKQADKVIELVCRRILAQDCEEEFGEIGKLTAEILRSHRYLDDMPTSVVDSNTKDEVIKTLKKVFDRYSLKAKHFITTKKYGDESWGQLETTDENFQETLLGVIFNYSQDTVRPVMDLNPSKKIRNRYIGPPLKEMDLDKLKITKRVTARVIAQLFDACGKFLQPAIIRGKVIYSRLCKGGYDWDDEIPLEMATMVKSYFQELVRLQEEFEPFPRAMLEGIGSQIKAIVGVRDGSSTGYGASIYFIMETQEGEVYSRIAGSKSRVSSRTMNDNECLANPLLLNLIADMMSELPELQRIEYLKIVSAGDSESISFAFNPERVEKAVLIKNATAESIRASRRILSYNASARIHFSWIPGEINASDLVSKEHQGLTQIINGQFYRTGHADYCKEDFGQKNNFYYLDAKEERYTSLREEKKEDNEDIVTEEIKKVEKDPAHEEFWSVLLPKFENLEGLVNAIVIAKKIGLKRSWKVNKTNLFSWNETVLRRTAWADIVRASQTRFAPEESKMMLPYKRDGIVYTRNRMNAREHLRYFGNIELPILSTKDEEMMRLIFISAHVVKTPATLPNDNETKVGVIHLSKYLTRCRIKKSEFGVWIPRATYLVRKHTAKCVSCLKEANQGVSTLEGDQFTASNWSRKMGLYSIIHVDLVGPFQWTPTHDTRRGVKNKLFVLVIVEAVTGAISFQLLEDYSTASFLLGFRTHIARTRMPQIVVCDAGTQLRAAARMNENQDVEEEVEEASLKKNDVVQVAERAFRQTQFIVAPTEAQWFNGKAEAQIKQAKKAMRSYFGRLRKQSIPTTGVFALENLLTTIADLLNSRPIYVDAEADHYLTANDILKGAFQEPCSHIDIKQLDSAVQRRYEEFCTIFENEVVNGTLTKATKTGTANEIPEGSFVMIKFPSKVNGFYKYGIVQAKHSDHRYMVRVIGRRRRDGKGKVVNQLFPSQNLVYLYKEQGISGMLSKKVSVTNTFNAGTEMTNKMANKPSQTRRRARRKALQGVTPDGAHLATYKARGYEVVMTGRDIKSLKPGQLVTDGIIDCYGSLLEKTSPGVVYIPCRLMQKINFSPSEAAQDAPNVFTEEVKTVLFPIHQAGDPGHWFLIVANTSASTLEVYNSLPGQSTALEVGRLRRFLCHISFTHKKTALDMSAWRVIHQDCPQQTNSTDCGVFTCLAMRMVSQKIPFTADQVPEFRKTLMSEIQRFSRN